MGDTFSVYVHKNLKNGKHYVGMTSQEPKKRWNYGFGYIGNPPMWRDIQESDWNRDWTHEVLETLDDKQIALEREAFFIGLYDSISNGYNTSEYSTSSFPRDEETKKKISKSRMGQTNRPRKAVVQLTMEGEEINRFESTLEASRVTGLSQGNICSCCNGRFRQIGGFLWRYL